jgi:hypothetical protein
MSKQVIDKPDAPPRLLSEFVSNKPGPAHFLMRWVPVPPEVRRRVVNDHERRTLVEVVEMDLGCPHCHEDIKFRYDMDSPDPGLLRRLYNVLQEIGSVEFSVASLLLGSRSEVARKLIDVATELKDALRRW